MKNCYESLAKQHVQFTQAKAQASTTGFLNQNHLNVNISNPGHFHLKR